MFVLVLSMCLCDEVLGYTLIPIQVVIGGFLLVVFVVLSRGMLDEMVWRNNTRLGWLRVWRRRCVGVSCLDLRRNQIVVLVCF